MLNHKVARAVRLAIACSIVPSVMFSNAALAQDSEKQIERIDITGSSIKRTDMEGSLPVDLITAEDIAKSGVTSVPDLIANLPSMQGFTSAGESVGGGGAGIQTASLRNLGAEYTLVLLNGHRMPSADSGGTINLNNIPLAAIKRVEILKDGASALYGSDAIGGVVNFILKDNVQETTISARFDKPQDTSSSNISFTTGFGDLSSDGYNFLFTFSRDEQDNLKSVDRDFARTGFIEFEHAGNRYYSAYGSSNAIPGNAYVTYNTRDEQGDLVVDEEGNNVTASYSFNPYRELNGNCHETSAPIGNTCMFDFTSTLEIQPESERNSLFLSGIVEVNDSMELYSTVSYTDFSMIARIAPYPTGNFVLPNDSAVVSENVVPYLPEGVSAEDLVSVKARWRTLPGGNRTYDNKIESKHIVFGARGEMNEWSYDVAYTHGTSEREEDRLTGFPMTDPFMALVTSGEVNVFADPNDLSDEQNQKVKDTMFSGLWETVETSLNVIEAKASRELFELDSGPVYLGVGFDYRQQEYALINAPGQNDQLVLFESVGTEFDLDRDTYGAFAEIIVPITSELEVTGSIRYDNVGGVSDSKLEGDQSVSGDEKDTTYKISAAYRPSDEWLFRASYGTGFKAPTMRQIGAPRLEFGVTANAYDCKALLGATNHPLEPYCFDETLQYDVYREGNAELSPEESTQYSFGFVWSGDSGTSMGIDYWNIEMKNQVRRLEENQIWSDSATYADKFVLKEELSTGDQIIAIVRSAQNVGESNTSGIDWHFDVTTEFAFGSLRTSVNGTYMIEDESLRVGTTDVWDSSLGKVGTNEAVTFRNIINVANTFTHGDFSHNLNIKARSGYTDASLSAYTIFPIDPITNEPDLTQTVDGSLIQKHVPVYMLIDYRLSYLYNDNSNIVFGIKNLMDKDAPRSFNGAAGHQVGYDPRYADAYGRTFYLQVNYNF